MYNACIYLCITGMAHLRAENNLSKTTSRRPRTHAQNHHYLSKPFLDVRVRMQKTLLIIARITFIFRVLHCVQKDIYQKTIFQRTRPHDEKPHLRRLFSYPFNASPVLSTGKYKIQPEMVAFYCGGFIDQKEVFGAQLLKFCGEW